MATRSKAKKRSRGRPSLPAAEKRQRVHVKLLQSDIDTAIMIGESSVTRGIERALRYYEATKEP